MPLKMNSILPIPIIEDSIVFPPKTTVFVFFVRKSFPRLPDQCLLLSLPPLSPLSHAHVGERERK